jgi:hypothetical protein
MAERACSNEPRAAVSEPGEQGVVFALQFA